MKIQNRKLNVTLLKDDTYKYKKIVKKTKRKINKIKGGGFLFKENYVTNEEHIMDFKNIGTILFLELDREYTSLNIFVYYYLKCSI